MRRLLLPVLAAALIAAPAAAHQAPAPTKQPTAVGVGGGAATVDAQATQAAIDVLRRGGNAVDAAIGAAGVLGVVEPYSCGIGGGGFMTVYSARDGKVHTIDSRETAPAAMQQNAFAGLERFEAQRVSGMSVGVPGTVRAWQKALQEFGTWPLRERAGSPGIAAAQHGFAVDPTFFQQTDEAKAIFADFPATAALYLDPDGSPRDVGTVIRNPDLARTYELIARQGPDAMYSGPLAQAIVDTVKHPPLRPGSTRQRAPRRHGALRPRGLQGDRPRPDAHRLPRAGRLRHGAALERRLDRGRDPQHPRGLSTSARCRASRRCTTTSRPRAWPTPTAAPTSPTRAT